MNNPLDLFQARVPFVDDKGRLTPEALRSFRLLLLRVGGTVGPSTTDLNISDDEDSGLEEFKLDVWKRLEAGDVNPLPVSEPFTDPMHPFSVIEPYTDPMHPLDQPFPDVQQLMTEVSELREEVTRLRRQINDIQQGTSP